MTPTRNATRTSLTVGVCLSILSTSSNSIAQPTIPSADLARCAEIATDAVRLACFDALAHELRQENNTAQVASAPTEALTVDTPLEAENEDAFGAELIGGREALGPDEIQSRLIGEFAGWRGGTTFRLENGQVWQQAEQGRLVFRSDAPMITIRRGSFGTYRLTVEGVNRSVRVRRLE